MPASKSPTRWAAVSCRFRRAISRSGGAKPTISGWPAAKCRATTPRSTREDNQFLIRDKSSRYGTYVNGEQVTERPLVHGDRIRLGRSGGAEMVFLLADSAPADRQGHHDRHRRPAPDCRPPRGAARARLRPRARRRAGAGARLGDRGQRRRARLHHAGGDADRRARVQDGALAGTQLDSRRQLRHQPQDSRRGLPHRRAAHRRRPARRRPGERAHGHGRPRHPQRAVRAAPAGALPRSRRSGGRGASHRRALPRQPREGIAPVQLHARRARDARDRGGRGDRERPSLPRDDGEGADGAGDADRGRDPAGAPAQGRPVGRVLPRRRVVAPVPIDRRRLLRLRRPVRRFVRVRARRRGGQGAAGGAVERDDAGHVRGAGGRQRFAVAVRSAR